MREELQSPEQSRPVLAAQIPSIPPFTTIIFTMDTLKSLFPLAPPPLSALLISTIPSSSSMLPVPSPSTAALSHGPSIRRTEPPLLQSIPSKPLFSVNVTILKKRAKHR